MLAKTTLRSAAVIGVALLAAGCADNKKQRMAMLEDVNRNLTKQLNDSRGALDAARRDSDGMARRLSDAEREAEYLRSQLDAKPTQEPAAPGWTAVPGGAMIAIEGSVLFAPGRIELRKEAHKALDMLASTVQGEYFNKDIFVFGHTDNQPIKKSGWTDHWQLSSERGLAVVRYLVSKGVSPARLVACGCGEHRPRVPNSSSGDQAKNRRVEIFAVEPQDR